MRSFTSFPSAHEYVSEVSRAEEQSALEAFDTASVSMLANGRLCVNGTEYELAKLARDKFLKFQKIPVSFFHRLPPDLAAKLFNHFFAQHIDDKACRIIRNGTVITNVELTTAGWTRKAPLIQVLIESAPRDTVRNDIRAIIHERPYGEIDVAFVSDQLTTEPRNADIVYGGVHLTVEASGAIQVSAATYRLVCSNGMIRRECNGGKHRIRRGSESSTLESVRYFAKQAWDGFEKTALAIRQLTETELGDARLVARSLLRAPFHVSQMVANTVSEQLSREANGARVTLYDLWNALSAVGTHDPTLLSQYGHRLRLGAGALTQRATHVCSQCQRLVLAQ